MPGGCYTVKLIRVQRPGDIGHAGIQWHRWFASSDAACAKALMNEYSEMIREEEELPTDAQLVRVSGKKYVFFSSKKSKKALGDLCAILEDVGEEYDEQHPDAPLHISCPCIIWDGADAAAWVKSVCS